MSVLLKPEGAAQLKRARRRQNSLPSGSARTYQLITALADIGVARTEFQEAFEFGVLVAVGGVDVEMQPRLPGFGLGGGDEDQSRLQSAEPFAWSDLHRAVVVGVEHDEVQYLAPERRQPLRIPAGNDQFGNTTCHGRNPTARQMRVTRPLLPLAGHVGKCDDETRGWYAHSCDDCAIWTDV